MACNVFEELQYLEGCSEQCHSYSLEYNRGFQENETVTAKRIILEEPPFNIAISSIEYKLKCQKQSDLQIVDLDESTLFQVHESAVTPKNSLSGNVLLQIKSICNLPDDEKAFAKNLFLQKIFNRWVRFARNKKLIQKYFSRWKTFRKENSETTIEKIDKFIERLQKQIEEDQKSHNTNNEHQKSKSKTKICEPHKSRFKAQQEIIEMQKAKLAEQTKIIESLKLGLIQEELQKSLKHTKNEIREIFNNCSERIKCKTVPTEAILQNALTNLIISSNKAPKFIQQMEKRALERAKNRQLILERKRLMDEEKRRIIQEAIERKQVQDEEEKKRNLEMIKVKRRLEFELQKQRQINKEKYLASMQNAERYHKKKLMQKVINGLLHAVYIAHNNWNKSETFYERKLKRMYLRNWMQFVEDKYKDAYKKAIDFYDNKALLRTFTIWKVFYKETVQSLQVATDYFDMQLQSKTFIHWHRQVCKEIVLYEKKEAKAQIHYDSRILLHYFYLWRTLPAVLKLERAKEEKKRKWREKVMEILPDYRPPNDD